MAKKYYDDEIETMRDRKRDKNSIREQRRNARKQKVANATAWQDEE